MFSPPQPDTAGHRTHLDASPRGKKRANEWRRGGEERGRKNEKRRQKRHALLSFARSPFFIVLSASLFSSVSPRALQARRLGKSGELHRRNGKQKREQEKASAAGAKTKKRAAAEERRRKTCCLLFPLAPPFRARSKTPHLREDGAREREADAVRENTGCGSEQSKKKKKKESCFSSSPPERTRETNEKCFEDRKKKKDLFFFSSFLFFSLPFLRTFSSSPKFKVKFSFENQSHMRCFKIGAFWC